MTDSRAIEKALFETVSTITDAQLRQDFLDQACQGNAALRTRLEKLLSVQASAEEFFSSTPAPLRDSDTRHNGKRPVDGESAERNGDSALLEGLNTRMGRYRLLYRLGEGGCGVVYCAEQEEPVKRRVALKVIRLGMDTESVIARFEAERQALAMMDHPNIAHVLDAGATDSGRPYFVMELVRGVKITEFCNEKHLDTRQRLTLFTQVCHAVQHAHQKGVIHRDIKPSNILVTTHDGVPVPKVIDFGIAKATEGRLTDNTVFTAYNHFIGTPAYMSPEQAEMTGLDVDTRSDIYSLGVLLYELLTGRTPFDNQTLLQSGLDGMRQTLRDQDPEPPSRFISSFQTDELTATALSRHVEPPKLISQLKGDLDWIVMKALEKDRSRRYETANGLSMDVQRYLDNEPITARPPSKLYRLRKLVRRNKAVFASGAAIGAALIVGLGLSTWLFFKERDLRRQAERGRVNEVLLRRQAEARATIGQAAMLLGQNRYEEAEQLVAGISSPETVLEGEAVFRPLGEWAAIQGRWKRASECFAVLSRVDETETWDVATLDDTRYSVALIEAGDAKGYETFRRAAAARFAKTTDPVVAERAVKNSLLVPADASVLAALAPLADVAAKSISKSGQSGESEPWGGALAWRCVSLGLMDYRRGHYLESVDWCKRCLAYSDDKQLARVATIHAIYAMADYQLGQPQNAHAQLAQCREMLESKFTDSSGLGDGGQGYWFDWDLCKTLAREASLLIGDQNAPAPSAIGIERNY